jgi:hypothetical protein
MSYSTRGIDMSNPLTPGDRGLVNVEIVKNGDGTIGAHGEVQIKSTKGDTFWVPEKDVYARKPNPEAA